MKPDVGLECLAGVLAGSVAAIQCIPCVRSGGYFVPTSDLVLADLTGRQDPHPLFELARRVTGSPPGGASRVLVLFDDLDVQRNWILPPDPPRVESLWPVLRSVVRSVLPAGAGHVVLLSEWLHEHGAIDAYEATVEQYTALFLESLTDLGARAPRQLMTRQLARRRRFANLSGAAADER
ncbi:hypothetical protein ACFQ07_09995, partial [Actinomadura adrarensis]